MTDHNDDWDLDEDADADEWADEDPLDHAAIPDNPDEDVEEPEDGAENPGGNFVTNGLRLGAEVGRKNGEFLGQGLVACISAVFSLFGTFVFQLGTLVPKSGGIFKRLFYVGAHGYFKKSGGDALNLNAKPNGTLQLDAVKYQQKLDDTEEQAGWKAKGREKVWHEGSGGRETDLLNGKTPLVLLDDDANERFPRSIQRTAEAIDIDRYAPVYENPQIKQVIDLDNDEQTRARADGGGVVQDVSWDVEDHGRFAEDVEVYPESPDDYDGMRISLRNAKELLAEQTDSQKIRDAKERGKLAGMDPSDKQAFVMKVFLMAMLGVVGALFVVLVLPKILASGGSGAGDAVSSFI